MTEDEERESDLSSLQLSENVERIQGGAEHAIQLRRDRWSSMQPEGGSLRDARQGASRNITIQIARSAVVYWVLGGNANQSFAIDRRRSFSTVSKDFRMEIAVKTGQGLTWRSILRGSDPEVEKRHQAQEFKIRPLLYFDLRAPCTRRRYTQTHGNREMSSDPAK